MNRWSEFFKNDAQAPFLIYSYHPVREKVLCIVFKNKFRIFRKHSCAFCFIRNFPIWLVLNSKFSNCLVIDKVDIFFFLKKTCTRICSIFWYSIFYFILDYLIISYSRATCGHSLPLHYLKIIIIFLENARAKC